MADKLAFYDTYGVEEYYVYDPPPNTLEVWLRQDGRLRRVPHLKDWTSPRLGIRFALTGDRLQIFDPRGQPFLSSVELAQRARGERQRAEQEAMRAQQERQRAEQESARAALAERQAQQERERAERLAGRLRDLGIEP